MSEPQASRQLNPLNLALVGVGWSLTLTQNGRPPRSKLQKIAIGVETFVTITGDILSENRDVSDL